MAHRAAHRRKKGPPSFRQTGRTHRQINQRERPPPPLTGHRGPPAGKAQSKRGLIFSCSISDGNNVTRQPSAAQRGKVRPVRVFRLGAIGFRLPVKNAIGPRLLKARKRYAIAPPFKRPTRGKEGAHAVNGAEGERRNCHRCLVC